MNTLEYTHSETTDLGRAQYSLSLSLSLFCLESVLVIGTQFRNLCTCHLAL